MTEIQQIGDFKSELIDRFGPLTTEASNLLLKIVLKVLAKKAGVSRVDLIPDQLILQFSESHQRNPAAVVELITSNPKRLELSPQYVLKAKLDAGNISNQLAQAKILLKEIAQRVNS
jgi:transcription-repair coupling factor (superfamily II helicase)